jgi:hypothetical protein
VESRRFLGPVCSERDLGVRSRRFLGTRLFGEEVIPIKKRRIIDVLQKAIVFFETTSIKLKEARMDKMDKNAPASSVGAAMAKATAEKAAEVTEVNEEIEAQQAPPWEEYILEVDEDEVPLMYHGLAIYGFQLVSTKFLDIVKHLVMSDEFHKEQIVESIVFSENMPTDAEGNAIFACYKPGLKRIGINLQHHFNGAVTLIKEVEGHMSIRGHVWYNMILSVLHELYHGLFIVTDAEGEMSDMFELEANCNEMADEALTALAQEYDIEPPSMGNEPFFGTRYMQFFIREIQKGEESWCKRQDALHDDCNIHFDDTSNEYIQKFRTFIRYTHGADPEGKDPTWDIAAKPLNVIPDMVELEQTLAVQHAAQGLQPAEPAPAAVIAAPIGGFHGVDDEAIAMMAVEDEMGGESSAYVMEDYDTLPPEAAGTDMSAGPVAPQTTHVVVESKPEAGPVEVEIPIGTNCSACKVAVEPTAAFCSGCGTKLAVEATPIVETTPFVPYVEPVVVAQQPITAPITTHRGAPGQQLRTGLVNHEWTAEQFRHIVERILFRAYAHLFNKCGYNVMSKPAFEETQKWGVLEPVFVGDACEDDVVSKVLLGHDTIENGINRINVPITDGYIRGFCTKKGMLPCYTLYFNANGQEIKRILLPTNPWKEKSPGVYSKPAMRAQQGAIIAWMMDGDDNATDKWKGRIENSVFYWS